MTKKIQNGAGWFLGLLMVVFGMNKFFGFIPVEPPADRTAQIFMGAMFTSYLFAFVAFAEMVGGALLLIPRTRVIGWLMLLPVTVNIALFHMAHDFVGNGIWILPTVLFFFLGWSLSKRLKTLIQ